MNIRLLSCAAALLVATNASATTFRVDDATDAVDATPGDGVCATAGGTCTLRAAVQEANAHAGPDRIRLRAEAYALQIAGSGEEDAATGDLDVRGRLRIVGRGAASTVVDGKSLDRVFDLQPGARARFLKLAVRGGDPPNNALGGGINAAQNTQLTLDRVLIESNAAFAGGGAASIGLVHVSRSTIRDNAADRGGGLAVAPGAVIEASTFDGNSAAGSATFTGHDILGAGEGPVTIVNSTITGQIQGMAFCGQYPSGCVGGPDFLLANVTVNEVSTRIGPRNGGFPREPRAPTFTLRNTIVGACDAELISQGYNFVQPEGCIILGDLTGVVVGDDPLLGSLKDNGGPTFTRLPVAVSAAVDGGNPATPGSGGFACEPFDQRGVARFLGMYCDIGAVEGH